LSEQEYPLFPTFELPIDGPKNRTAIISSVVISTGAAMAARSCGTKMQPIASVKTARRSRFRFSAGQDDLRLQNLRMRD
jgi:hypothetical protein